MSTTMTQDFGTTLPNSSAADSQLSPHDDVDLVDEQTNFFQECYDTMLDSDQACLPQDFYDLAPGTLLHYQDIFVSPATQLAGPAATSLDTDTGCLKRRISDQESLSDPQGRANKRPCQRQVDNTEWLLPQPSAMSGEGSREFDLTPEQETQVEELLATSWETLHQVDPAPTVVQMPQQPGASLGGSSVPTGPIHDIESRFEQDRAVSSTSLLLDPRLECFQELFDIPGTSPEMRNFTPAGNGRPVPHWTDREREFFAIFGAGHVACDDPMYFMPESGSSPLQRRRSNSVTPPIGNFHFSPVQAQASTANTTPVVAFSQIRPLPVSAPVPAIAPLGSATKGIPITRLARPAAVAPLYDAQEMKKADVTRELCNKYKVKSWLLEGKKFSVKKSSAPGHEEKKSPYREGFPMMQKWHQVELLEMCRSTGGLHDWKRHILAMGILTSQQIQELRQKKIITA